MMQYVGDEGADQNGERAPVGLLVEVDVFALFGGGPVAAEHGDDEPQADERGRTAHHVGEESRAHGVRGGEHADRVRIDDHRDADAGQGKCCGEFAPGDSPFPYGGRCGIAHPSTRPNLTSVSRISVFCSSMKVLKSAPVR